MERKTVLAKAMLLAGIVAGGILVLAAGARTSAASTNPATVQAAATAAGPARATNPSAAQSAATKPGAKPGGYRFSPSRFPRRADLYYRLRWGVDDLRVRYAESGEIIRFSYRVLDAEKAAPVNDKKFDPALYDPKARVKLVVPALEKVGKLRQAGSTEAGKEYWMAFSNKGRYVRPGDHVDVVIGDFRASGLVVE